MPTKCVSFAACIRINLRTRNIGWHGNALLVKRHIGVLDVSAIDLPTLEPRGAVMAELLIADRPLRVIGMHLDLSGLWRRSIWHTRLARCWGAVH
jgi:endonuclease/exonuclease/phosphatase family metal-dependent hydrolase